MTRNHAPEWTISGARCVWCGGQILASADAFKLPDGGVCHDTAWCRGELNAYEVNQGSWRENESGMR